MSFQEYPKHMNHPAYRPAVIAKWDPKIKDPKEQPQGSAAKFPPVIVHNLDQEQQYAAVGYKPNGVSDPEAYRKQMTGNTPRPDGSEKEYPRMLYKAADNEQGYSYETAANKEVEKSLLAKGFKVSLADVLNPSEAASNPLPEKAAQAAPEAPAGASPQAAERSAPASTGGRVKKPAKDKAKAKKSAKKG